MNSVQMGVCSVPVGRSPKLVGLAASTILAVLCAFQASGQEIAELSFRERATDLVILKDDTQLRGVLIPASRGGVLIRSEWLRTHAANFFTEHVQPQWEAAQAAQPKGSALRDAIRQEHDQLKQMPGFDAQHAGLLGEVMMKLEPEPGQMPKLLVLQLPGNLVRRRQAQPERIQRIGFLGLLNDLPNVESAAWRELADQLAQIPPATLRSSLPQNGSSTEPTDDLDRQRSAVLASVEYRLGRTAKFVQTGSAVLPEDGPVDVQGLMTQMLGQGLQNQLADLLNEAGAGAINPSGQPGGAGGGDRTAPESVRRAAEARGLRTVAISSFSTNVSGGSAVVERRLYRRNDQGEWPLIYVAAGQSTVAELTDAEQKAVSDDPQIKEITALFGGLGVGTGEIAKALQMGSVVRRAADRSSAALEEFVTQALNGRVSGTAADSVLVIEIKAAR